MNARPNRVPKDFFGEGRDSIRQDRIVCRVLDCVGRQSAPIPDEMSEQSELGARHGVLVRTLKDPGQCDPIAGFDLIQAPPTLDRQELVVCSCANTASEFGDQSEYWLPA